MEQDTPIYLAGHRGLVGEALYRRLQDLGFRNIITATSKEVDLRSQQQTASFLERTQPQAVLVAAARVGGIGANNDYPAEFIYENLMIATNLVHQSYVHNVKQLLFLGSSCIYPSANKQPIVETDLLTGPLEPTNAPYAIAKIAGLNMCHSYRRQYQCDYRALMPCNLYGNNDNFNLDASHVIPAVIHKFDHAVTKQLAKINFWGSGNVQREFLHADDAADACITVMRLTADKYDELCDGSTHINLGSGKDMLIKELVNIIADIYKYTGQIIWDASKPSGTKRKLLDVRKLSSIGWKPSISMREGLESTVAYYRANSAQLRH